MEHLKFQYKKFWESGALQEPYIGFIRPFKNSSFHCHNPDSLKVITRLRLIHKFKNSFEDTLNPIYNCDTVETTIHYLLRCPNFSKEKLTLQQTSKNWWKYFKSNISKVLLFGDHSFNVVKNTCFKCFNWIYNFNKTFWCSFLSKLTLFNFRQEIALSLMLLSFVISIPAIAYFRLFCKITCIIRFFFLNLLCLFMYVSSTSKNLL